MIVKEFFGKGSVAGSFFFGSVTERISRFLLVIVCKGDVGMHHLIVPWLSPAERPPQKERLS